MDVPDHQDGPRPRMRVRVAGLDRLAAAQGRNSVARSPTCSEGRRPISQRSTTAARIRRRTGSPRRWSAGTNTLRYGAPGITRSPRGSSAMTSLARMALRWTRSHASSAQVLSRSLAGPYASDQDRPDGRGGGVTSPEAARIRRYFPVLGSVTYLASCSLGAPSTETGESLADTLRDMSHPRSA